MTTVGLVFSVLASGCELIWDREPEPSVSRWQPGSGWAAVTVGEPSPTAMALRAEARKAFEAEAYNDALLGLLEVREKYPKSQVAAEADTSFLTAECYFQLNDYERAYDEYRETLTRRPTQDILQRTLARVYNIGLAYLHGVAKRQFAGISYASPSFGVEILIGEDGLVTHYPFRSFSDDALWQIAEYYSKKKQYAEAERVLEWLVREYRDSEWNEGAEYQLALSVFRQIRGEDYDQEPLKKARRKFDLYRVHYPRGSKIALVREHLREISEMEARHDLKVAKYYLRESRPEAAVYYLRSVILNHYNTDAASEAREIFKQMERFHDSADEEIEEGVSS